MSCWFMTFPFLLGGGKLAGLYMVGGGSPALLAAESCSTEKLLVMVMCLLWRGLAVRTVLATGLGASWGESCL